MSPPTNERPFPCTLCDKSFSFVFSLKRHMTIHNAPTFVCTHCDKAYKTKGLLKSHEAVHSGKRPYKCEICSKFYMRKEDVMRHLRIVHQRKGIESRQYVSETAQAPDIPVNAREFGEKPEVKVDLETAETNLPPMTDKQPPKADSATEFGDLLKNSSGSGIQNRSTVIKFHSSLTGDRKEQPEPLFIINDSVKAAENIMITVSIGTGIAEQGSSVDPNPSDQFQIAFQQIMDELTKAGSKTVNDNE